jgi:hypothetical protein
VATSWNSIDKETKDYCLTVARILKQRHAELLCKVGEVECLPTIALSSVLGHKKDTKKRRVDSNAQVPMMKGRYGDNELEFPQLPFGLGQADETKRRRLDNTFADQRTNQYPAMCVPFSIDHFPNDAIRLYQHYLPSQAITQSSTTMRINGELGFSDPEVHRTQQGFQGAQMPMRKGSYGDNEPGLSTIANVSRRAAISNMISAIHTCHTPITHGEGISSFGANSRPLAPERLQTTQQEQLEMVYKARELDISDSDVFAMWRTSMDHDDD